MAETLNFDSGDQVLEFLAHQLSDTPLYTQVGYSDSSETRLLPGTIGVFCDICNKETNWETYVHGDANHRTGFSEKGIHVPQL